MMEKGASCVVKLNIGGHKYITTVSTLTGSLMTEEADGGSTRTGNFFVGLLSGRIPTTKVDDDFYFIDRNGRYFEPILDYLRTGRWALPNRLIVDERLVLAEAEFYGIDVFAHISDRSIAKTRQNMKVVSEHFSKQLDAGAVQLATPKLCLAPEASVRAAISPELHAQFDQLMADIVFCEVEEVDIDVQIKFVSALLWDFKVNGELSLRCSIHEVITKLHGRLSRLSNRILFLRGSHSGFDDVQHDFQWYLSTMNCTKRQRNAAIVRFGGVLL